MSGFTIQVNDATIVASSAANALQIYNCLVNVVRIAEIDGPHGLDETPTNIVTNMPARIKWSRGKERLQFDKQTAYRDGTLHCRKPAGVIITTKDRISYNGEEFEITAVEDFRNLGRLLEIGIKRTG